MFTVAKDTQITLEIVKQAIEYNQKRIEKFDTLERYYDGEHDILGRVKTDTLKNNKSIINHAEYIVDMLTGYLVGNPVEYQAEEGVNIDPILDQYKQQKISTFDYELAENIGIFGVYYERIYADENNNIRSTLVDPRTCVCIYDNTVAHEKLGAVIYMVDNTGSTVELYLMTKNEVIYYKVDNEIFTEQERDVHKFKIVPVIEYSNTRKQKSDFIKVKSGIDAYNILQSDRVNDKEQLVEALLMFYGINLTPTMIADLKLNRWLTSIPVDARAEYLVKQLNEDQVEILAKRIVDDIHKISGVPNMSDENFVGNSSGVALSYKLLPFEQKTKKKERFFEIGLMERFTIYNNYLVAISKDGMSEVPAYKVDAVFKRNLPQNLLEISTIITNLAGIVSKETLIGQLPFVKDAKEEIKQADKESLKKFNQQSPTFGTTQVTPNTNNDVSKKQ